MQMLRLCQLITASYWRNTAYLCENDCPKDEQDEGEKKRKTVDTVVER